VTHENKNDGTNDEKTEALCGETNFTVGCVT